MLANHPFGFGANQYVVVANTEQLAEPRDFRPGRRFGGERSQRLLARAAETGYFGLATYIFLLASCATYVFRRACRYRNDRRGDLILGIGVTFCIIYIHSLRVGVHHV